MCIVYDRVKLANVLHDTVLTVIDWKGQSVGVCTVGWVQIWLEGKGKLVLVHVVVM